jgi:hypothetical protein
LLVLVLFVNCCVCSHQNTSALSLIPGSLCKFVMCMLYSEYKVKGSWWNWLLVCALYYLFISNISPIQVCKIMDILACFKLWHGLCVKWRFTWTGITKTDFRWQILIRSLKY